MHASKKLFRSHEIQKASFGVHRVKQDKKLQALIHDTVEIKCLL